MARLPSWRPAGSRGARRSAQSSTSCRAKTGFERLEIIQVETEPLDVHVGRFSRIDLIKVDVEGAEDQVFAGMERPLGSGVVRRVTFEVSRDLMGDEWKPFTDRLRRLQGDGWAFFTISKAGPPEPLSLTAMFERGRYSHCVDAGRNARDRLGMRRPEGRACSFGGDDQHA